MVFLVFDRLRFFSGRRPGKHRLKGTKKCPNPVRDIRETFVLYPFLSGRLRALTEPGYPDVLFVHVIGVRESRHSQRHARVDRPLYSQ